MVAGLVQGRGVTSSRRRIRPLPPVEVPAGEHRSMMNVTPSTTPSLPAMSHKQSFMGESEAAPHDGTKLLTRCGWPPEGVSRVVVFGRLTPPRHATQVGSGGRCQDVDVPGLGVDERQPCGCWRRQVRTAPPPTPGALAKDLVSEFARCPARRK